MDMSAWKAPIVSVVEVAGVLIIIGGSGAAAIAFVSGVRRSGFDQAYTIFRRNLGRAILLGLEFLVAADIINTVAVEPTFRDVGVLAVIVLIRTFLSFSIEVEIEGRWPWARGYQRKTGTAAES
jgi:uncharacterized membrane protein